MLIDLRLLQSNTYPDDEHQVLRRNLSSVKELILFAGLINVSFGNFVLRS